MYHMNIYRHFIGHIVQIPYRNGQMTAANLLPHAMVIMDEILNRPRKKINYAIRLKNGKREFMIGIEKRFWCMPAY